jgi:hypothetical protein
VAQALELGSMVVLEQVQEQEHMKVYKKAESTRV